MGGISNAALSEKISGVQNLLEVYVKHSEEHRAKADQKMDGIYDKVSDLDEKVGIQNGRVTKIEECQQAHGLDIDCIKKKPVVLIFDNWKFLIMLTLGLAVIINFINPLLAWVVELFKGINLEIGI